MSVEVNAVQSVNEFAKICQELVESIKPAKLSSKPTEHEVNTDYLLTYLKQHFTGNDGKTNCSLMNCRRALSALHQKRQIAWDIPPGNSAPKDWNMSNTRAEAIAKTLEFESQQKKVDDAFRAEIFQNAWDLVEHRAPGITHSAKKAPQEDLRNKFKELKAKDDGTPLFARKFWTAFEEFYKNYKAKDYMRPRPV